MNQFLSQPKLVGVTWEILTELVLTIKTPQISAKVHVGVQTMLAKKVMLTIVSWKEEDITLFVCFVFLSFYSYRDVTFAGEGLQILTYYPHGH